MKFKNTIITQERAKGTLRAAKSIQTVPNKCITRPMLPAEVTCEHGLKKS